VHQYLINGVADFLFDAIELGVKSTNFMILSVYVRAINGCSLFPLGQTLPLRLLARIWITACF